MKKLFSVVMLVSVAVSVMAHPNRMYLIGDATPNGWDLDNAALMITESEGVYEWVGELKDGELKFLINTDWMPSYGPANNGDALVTGTIELVQRVEELAENDNKFFVSAGRWALHIDLTGETPVLIVADGADLEDKGFANHYPEFIYPVGEATLTGWSLDDAVAVQETAFNSGIYQADITLQSGQLKFLKQRNWGKNFGATEADAPIEGEGEFDIMTTDDSNDNKFIVSLEEETDFELVLNAVTGKLTLSKSTTAVELVNSDEKVLVFDLSGKLRLRTTVGQLNDGELNAGIYIVKGTGQTRKIIIK